MPYSHILFDTDDAGIAQVTVNRPEKLNALSAAVIGELRDVFERIAGDPAVRGVIVTGSGAKAFVAGADIAELAALSPEAALEYSVRGQRAFRALETCGKPSVAAINGFALGGGLELALACSVRFASEEVRLGQPEVKLGLIPGFGGTQRLPRLVGRGRALQLLLSGEPVTAAEALQMGLVNAVVPAGELIAFSRAWLSKALANGPVALKMAMEAVDSGLDCPIEQAMRLEASAFGICAATQDSREGTRAFLEKRSPRFAGK